MVLQISLLVRSVLGGGVLLCVRLTDLGLGIGFLLAEWDRRPEYVFAERFDDLGEVSGGRFNDLGDVA